MSKKDLLELIKDQQRQITKLSDHITFIYTWLVKKENESKAKKKRRGG